jgi:hypothetical protein
MTCLISSGGRTVTEITLFITLRYKQVPRGSIVVEAPCYKPKGREFDTR